MNCKQVRKYLYAFADGQLSVLVNCEVLDHLKMCPACSAIVEEHQSLRMAIRRSTEKIQVPQALKDHVLHAIRTGRLERRSDKPGHASRWAGFRSLGRWKGVTLAACLTLATTAVWYIASHNRSTHNDLKQVAVSHASSRAQLASMISVRHEMCVANCQQGMHQNAGLPRDRHQVAQAIHDHFDGKLAAIAPDLSDRGFRFDSANFCCIPREKGCVSGHVMYVNHNKKSWLSFFSLPHWKVLDECNDNHAPDLMHPFQYTLPKGNQSTTILAWHQNKTTYVCCGVLNLAQMRDIASVIQIAMREPHRAVMLASIIGR